MAGGLSHRNPHHNLHRDHATACRLQWRERSTIRLIARKPIAMKAIVMPEAPDRSMISPPSTGATVAATLGS